MTYAHSSVSIRSMANAVRALSMDAVEKANSGHPGMPMGFADVATVLWTELLRHNPDVPQWPNRDRFILSVGHGSMLLYSLLHLTGYADMTIEELQRFRQLGSKTCGHPEYGHAAGIETTTGPLGQGLANAVGMALAERRMRSLMGEDIIHHHTYVVVGDGCLMEGIAQEALSFAAHQKLDKLIILFDDNGITIDGSTSLATSENHCARCRALGFDVHEVDGHDPVKITEALFKARASDAPSFIACKTTIAYGAPTKKGTSSSHGSPLGKDEIAGAREALDWNYAPFEVPQTIYDAWRESVQDNKRDYDAWCERYAALPEEKRADFERLMSGALPHAWVAALEEMKEATCAQPVNEATRQSSAKILEILTAHIPELIGGSADLTGSNLTKTSALEGMTPAKPDGRYVYYGIREHAMGAIMNGLALYGGCIAYGGTFLVFADYMRPAMRLSALMNLGVIYVMTHDSIGVGEDGPTHQPIEHLASLRAMPHLNVFRPADRIETIEAWALAIAARTKPSVLALTRQALPQLRYEYAQENKVAYGAYALRQSDDDRAVLVATGSEVSLAIEAYELLQQMGVHVRVVSMPCMELFFEQTEEYRTSLIPQNLPVVGIEAACSFGWHRILGARGAFVGLDHFGTSAPAKDVYRHMGLTSQAVVRAVQELI
ncbi:MAG: transketolase [Alphaproteobacteria bacterium]|nr:MAG: transketolase [Alphaproteobacteria bacterium]TAF75466.1 MAG: transketolase [Alphaproteobacteria bacterium]